MEFLEKQGIKPMSKRQPSVLTLTNQDLMAKRIQFEEELRKSKENEILKGKR